MAARWLTPAEAARKLGVSESTVWRFLRPEQLPSVLARLRCRVFQTTFLRAETHALLRARLGAGAARQWLSAPASPTVRPEPADEVRGERIVIRYRDKDFSLCDAIAFAVMDRLR